MPGLRKASFGGPSGVLLGKGPSTSPEWFYNLHAGITTTTSVSCVLTSVPALTDPADITGVTAFWDSRSNCTAASWVDRVGAFDLAQGTAGNRPTLTASDSDFGGKPSLTFDGSDDYLSVSGTDISNIISVGAYEVFAVAKISSSTNNAASYSNPAVINDLASGYWGLHVVNPSGTNFTYRMYTWGGGDKHEDIATDNAVRVVGAKLDGGKLYTRLGSAGAWSAGTAAADVQVDTGTIAMGTNGTVFLGFKVCAVVVANAVLSSGDETDILQYLETYFT